MSHVFTNLKQVYEQPNLLNGKFPLRIYTTDFGQDQKKVRYHIGWPAILFPSPIWELGMTESFMGDKYWLEQDGFYLFWKAIITPIDAPIPFNKLNESVTTDLKTLNRVVAFLNGVK